jgi:hypothetical protein
MGKASGGVAIIPLGNFNFPKRNASSLPTGHARSRPHGNPRLSSIRRRKMLSYEESRERKTHRSKAARTFLVRIFYSQKK